MMMTNDDDDDDCNYCDSGEYGPPCGWVGLCLTGQLHARVGSGVEHLVNHNQTSNEANGDFKSLESQTITMH